jgi:hypothetical protein
LDILLEDTAAGNATETVFSDHSYSSFPWDDLASRLESICQQLLVDQWRWRRQFEGIELWRPYGVRLDSTLMTWLFGGLSI